MSRIDSRTRPYEIIDRSQGLIIHTFADTKDGNEMLFPRAQHKFDEDLFCLFSADVERFNDGNQQLVTNRLNLVKRWISVQRPCF